MRGILGDLETSNRFDIINEIASNFYKMRTAVNKDALDTAKAERLLSEFRELLGSDPIDLEIERRGREAAKAAHQGRIATAGLKRSKLDELNRSFMALLTNANVTPQQRGFEFERIFFDLLELSEIECRRPFRNISNEQIDGHFRYEKFDYLVEVKWTSELTKQPDLSIFDGKIRGKVQSTRGFFLSQSGFDDSAIVKFSGDSPRIVLMSGEDIALILGGQILIEDAMKAKIDAIVRHGTIFFPLRTMAT
ncbi:hypothetical protein S4A8_06835 [Salinisphaera sp. S4-8]